MALPPSETAVSSLFPHNCEDQKSLGKRGLFRHEASVTSRTGAAALRHLSSWPIQQLVFQVFYTKAANMEPTEPCLLHSSSVTQLYAGLIARAKATSVLRCAWYSHKPHLLFGLHSQKIAHSWHHMTQRLGYLWHIQYLAGYHLKPNHSGCLATAHYSRT